MSCADWQEGDQSSCGLSVSDPQRRGNLWLASATERTQAAIPTAPGPADLRSYSYLKAKAQAVGTLFPSRTLALRSLAPFPFCRLYQTRVLLVRPTRGALATPAPPRATYNSIQTLAIAPGNTTVTGGCFVLDRE